MHCTKGESENRERVEEIQGLEDFIPEAAALLFQELATAAYLFLFAFLYVPFWLFYFLLLSFLYFLRSFRFVFSSFCFFPLSSWRVVVMGSHTSAGARLCFKQKRTATAISLMRTHNCTQATPDPDRLNLFLVISSVGFVLVGLVFLHSRIHSH